MVERSTQYYRWIIEAIDQIDQYVVNMTSQEFAQDRKTQDACLMQLQHIGETVIQLTKIDHDFTITNKDHIIKFRNLLSHHYQHVRVGFIWSIIQQDMSVLRKEIQEKLK